MGTNYYLTPKRSYALEGGPTLHYSDLWNQPPPRLHIGKSSHE